MEYRKNQQNSITTKFRYRKKPSWKIEIRINSKRIQNFK